MTTLAVVDPPLRRLFSRLDFAPRPLQKGLSDLLAIWEELRGASVAPELARAENRRLPTPSSSNATRTGGIFFLRRASLGLERLTGLDLAGGRLSASPDLRHAARLRRLFQTVVTAGEPVLAEFSAEGLDDASLVVDLLAAPLADSKGRTIGILGGCELRRSLRRRGAAPASRGARRPNP